MIRFCAALATIAGFLLLASCSNGTSSDAADSTLQIADDGSPGFRVRDDMAAALDADAGWAAPANQPTAVTADRPFRLRLELAPAAGLTTDCLGLQYRRNGDAWTPVEAHDFPYPLRKREVTFAADAAGSAPAGWQVASGTAGGLLVTRDGEDALLRASAADAGLLALYPAPWRLEGAFGFAAGYLLPARGVVSLVFGFVDVANHWRLVLEAGAGMMRVVRIVDGVEIVIAEHAAEVPSGEWLETEVQLEDGVLEINFDDDAAEFSVPAEGEVPARLLGFHVPRGQHVDFRWFVIEGEPSSPRVSIVATDAYPNGAPTGDLLTGAAMPHAAGAGVNLAECVDAEVSAGRHAEFEWPLVIRRFADRAATNETGDVFEFRLADASGRGVAGAPVPRLTLEVADGHLGGTFVETPGRVGPWQAGNGDLYFIMEPAESDNLFMMVKSTDGGRSWREVDGANRPATGDLESVDGRLVGDTVYILHQVTEATYHHAFRTADHPETPDAWAITDELAATVTAHSQMASLVVRPDGSLVGFHLGDTVGYSIRDPAGTWRDEVVIADDGPMLAGPQAVLGANGVVHLAYYRSDGTLWYRRLLPDDTLTAAVQLDADAGTREEDFGAVLPLVYLPRGDTVVVFYRLADGKLRERRITGDDPPSAAAVAVDRRVVQHAVDSQQPAADAVAHGDMLAVLFVDEADGSLYAAVDRGEGWEPPTLQVDGIRGMWVRGNVYRRAAGAVVYGYVYDAGSYGGAGMNRYAELLLEAP